MFSFRRAGKTAITIAVTTAMLGIGVPAMAAVEEPLGEPDLKSSSDSGVSNSDDVTNVRRPVIVAAGASTCDADRILQRLSGDVFVTVETTCAIGSDGPEYTPTADLSETTYTLRLARLEETSTSLEVTIDATGLVPAAGSPGVPNLDADSDTGASSTDNYTRSLTRSFTIDPAALPEGAAAIELLRNGASLSAPVYGTSPLVDASKPADGVLQYSARFVDAAGNGGTPSSALAVTLDTSGLVLAFFSSNCDSGRSNTDTYTRGLCAGITTPGLNALNGFYVGLFTVVGGNNGLPITVTRTDPAGTVTPLANVTPSALTGGVAFIADLLSVLPGSPPLNGRWNYALGGTDLAGNTVVGLGSMTIDTVAPALPVVDLDAGSDVGRLNNDNVTQWNAATGTPSSLNFTITSEVESQINFFRNGFQINPALQTVAGGPFIPTPSVPNGPTGTVPFSDNGLFSDATRAFTLSTWHGFVAEAIDKAGNSSSGNLPVYIDVDTPGAPLQLDLIIEDDTGGASDDNITNRARPRFQVSGAEEGSIVELTACEGPGCTLVLSLVPFVQVATRTTVIGTITGNGIIQPDDKWWEKTPAGRVKILDNYTSGNGPAFPGNTANTSWRFSVRQRDLSGRQGTTFSQDLNVVIDTTPLPTPSKPEWVTPGELTIASSTTGQTNPTFRVETGQGRVELLRNGVVVASRTGGGLITDPGPLANGTYTYTSRAVDTAGNISAQSAGEEVTVQNGGGYWLVGSDGGVFSFGDAGYFGSMGGTPLNAPVLAISPTPTKKGYWLLGQDGGVFSLGDAGFYGSTGDRTLNSPILGMVPSKTGKGYWLFAPDGGVFAFGDAPFLGAAASSSPTSPIVAMQAAPDGKGYWLVAANGQVYSFGSASFLSGLENDKLNSPIVGAAATGSGKGLWLVGADGGVFTLGDASFHGSTGGMTLNQPIIGIAGLPGTGGYYLLAKDGGVFSFGAAAFHGSTGGMVLNKPVVGMAIS